MQYFIILCLFIFTYPTQADVITDGSLGDRVALVGTEYAITESLGTRANNNLFHSFERFNLAEGETAVFSGAADIANVISRVTGGEPSLIDGTIASDLKADFYFINPYGILFNKNSRLSLQGSFYASTADVLRFSDGQDFDSLDPENNLLSIAEPTAFGFLYEQASPIYVQQARLSVRPLNTLAFIGNQPTILGASLFAGVGQLYIVGIGGEGEVEFKTNYANNGGGNITYNSELDLKTDKPAAVNIQYSSLNVSGQKSGNVYIRGGQVVLETTQIQASTINIDGGIVDIQAQDIQLSSGSTLVANATQAGDSSSITLTATNDIVITGERIAQEQVIPTTIQMQVQDGASANIQLSARNIQVTDGAKLAASSWNLGQGGNIILHAAEQIDIKGTTSQGEGSQIGANARGTEQGAGDGGTVQLQAKSIYIADGAQIGSLTSGLGNGGQLLIQAQDLTITGEADYVTENGNTPPTTLNANTTLTGQGGNIDIEVDTLQLQDRAMIAAGTRDQGNAGNIRIKAKNVTLSNSSADKYAGNIIANTQGQVANAGRGGNIEVITDNLTLLNGAQLTSSTTGAGQGGNISVEVAKIALFDGVSFEQRFASGLLSLSTDGSTGNAGTVRLKSTGLLLNNHAQINAQTRGTGLGGTIAIQTEGLVLQNGGAITAQSYATGDAGSLILDVGNTLVLNQSGAIQTSTETADGGNVVINIGKYFFMRNSELSTSVGADIGNGGNINLNSQFTILHDSPIIARAFGGNGGNIDIVTRSVYKMQPTVFSPIDASSRFGLDGVVTISTPDVGAEEGLLVLPENFIRADVMLAQSCNTEALQSRFVLQERIGITPLQSDWQPAHF